ncbi:MAG: hypothetical protein ACERLG_00120 [Sedimentibacter sp.]
MNKPNNSKIYKAAIHLRLYKEDDSLGDGGFKSESNSITNQSMLILNLLDSVSDISPIMEFVDDSVAPVIKDSFSMKQIGFSTMAIADKLNERGILSPNEYKKSMEINCSPGFKKEEIQNQ